MRTLHTVIPYGIIAQKLAKNDAPFHVVVSIFITLTIVLHPFVTFVQNFADIPLVTSTIFIPSHKNLSIPYQVRNMRTLLKYSSLNSDSHNSKTWATDRLRPCRFGDSLPSSHARNYGRRLVSMLVTTLLPTNN